MKRFNLTIQTDYFCEFDLDGLPYTIITKNEKFVIKVQEGIHLIKLSWTSNRDIFIEQEVDVTDDTDLIISFEDYIFNHPDLLKTVEDFQHSIYNFPRFKAIWNSFDSYDVDVMLSDTIPVVKDGIKGFVDRLGREALDYYYVIQNGSRYGFAHGLGRIIVPASFSLPLCELIDDAEYIKLPAVRQAVLQNQPSVHNFMGLKYGIGLVHEDNRWGFVDLKCEKLTPIMFDEVKIDHPYYKFSTQVDIPVKKGCLWGIYNLEKRKHVIACQYEEVYRNYGSDCYVYRSGDKYGLISPDGSVISGAIYENRIHIESDLIPVSKDGKWGFINHRNAECIPFLYDECRSFIEEVAFVKHQKKWGIINAEGTLLYPFELDFPGATKDGYSFIIKEGKWGVIDGQGNTVISCEYDEIDTNTGKFCWIEDYVTEDTGEIVQVSRCCEIESLDYFVTKKGDAIRYFNLLGEEIVQCDNDTNESAARISPQVIPLNADYRLVRKDEGWRLVTASGEYVDDQIFEDCVVNYGKVSVKKNGLYREISREDAKLVGHYMTYPPRYGDDNGVGTPIHKYEASTIVDSYTDWVDDINAVIDHYGNIIWKPSWAYENKQ